MQLIEVSMIGVRSAVITLQRPGHPLHFTIFPMVHLGADGFYQAVAARLAQCDVIVTEGVSSDSVLTRALTSTYRRSAKSERLGLVVQNIDYAPLAARGIEVIRPELTADQFDRGLRKLPWKEKAAIATLSPVAAIAFRLFGTRQVLSRYLNLDDDDDDNPDRPNELPGLARLILDDRDELLTRTLGSIAQTRGEEPIDVGVVYGAEHMIAVVRSLARLGYRPRKGAWLTVFDYE